MSVVSNASPLINLARIGKLDLLRQIYGELFIPEAVWHTAWSRGSEGCNIDQSTIGHQPTPGTCVAARTGCRGIRSHCFGVRDEV